MTSLVANWIRVGYCQGNFNSDNCAAGGFTLDYGPFGFCDVYDPQFQPWTGGGHHFSFMNQPVAAERNFHMFWTALRPLLVSNQDAMEQLDEIRSGFKKIMQSKLESMWAAKLGLEVFDAELFNELEVLMMQTQVDYTIFFRELSAIPDNMTPLKKSFYKSAEYNVDPEQVEQNWSRWFKQWQALSLKQSGVEVDPILLRTERSKKMKLVNPKYNLREWFVVPAYQQASIGNYALIKELQEVMTRPYEEQSGDVEQKFYKLKPSEFFEAGGLSHYSCSS